MIRFSRYQLLYLAISLVVIGAGVFSIIRWGYIVSIDFTGGTEIMYQVDRSKSGTLTRNIIKDVVSKSGGAYQMSEVGEDGVLTIRAKDIDEKKEQTLRNALVSSTTKEVTLLKFNVVGPIVGKESIYKTLIAVGLGILTILGYIFYAFKRFSFALGAIVALVHDFLVVLGMYSLVGHFFGAQLDTLFVTALLTTMTFSTHDTIVIFDKIREFRKSNFSAPIDELADRAVTSTMVRSINNSLTILFMLVALVLLGGASIRFFALTLLIGTLTGVYSSPFVATPVMMWLEKRRK